jgi:hypothetical protein
MSVMDSIVEELRQAGLTVIAGRTGIGRTYGVVKVESVITASGRSYEGAADLNELVTPSRGVAYVERSGRVWLLADGPVNGSANAVVFVAAHKAGDIGDKQQDAVDVLTAVLETRYGIDDQAAAPPENDDEPEDQTTGDPE